MMTLPDKIKLGAEIKRISIEKSITPEMLAVALKKTSTTIYNVYSGNASYKLLESAINMVDNWNQKD